MRIVMSTRIEMAFTRGAERGRVFGKDTAGYQRTHDSARCLAKALGWQPQALMEKVAAFHRERLEAVPDLTRYPELRGYRELLLEEYRGMGSAGVDSETIALVVSLGFWRDTRLIQETGRAVRAAALPEKCRIVYTPDSDEGALHAKNVDEPLTYWRPRPKYAPNSPWPHPHPLFFDGVGSGLHLDEVSPEIFPVNVLELCRDHCTTVEAATEFLVRYNFFWSNQNMLVHDMHGNSVAFDKTRCRVSWRKPNAQGISFINGMGALDPGIRAFQRQQREKYLQQQGQTWDSTDGCYWKVCEGKWANMERYVAEFSKKPTWAGLKELMEQRDPSGPMCLTGRKSHPDEQAPGCSVVMDIWMVDQKKLHRRQWRGETPAYLDTPELVQFTATPAPESVAAVAEDTEE